MVEVLEVDSQKFPFLTKCLKIKEKQTFES